MKVANIIFILGNLGLLAQPVVASFGWVNLLVDLEAERRAGIERTYMTYVSAPEEFNCPITAVRMQDPVIAADGHTYERWAIMQVLSSADPRSPITRASLANTIPVPNYALRTSMNRWLVEHGLPELQPTAAGAARLQTAGSFIQLPNTGLTPVQVGALEWSDRLPNRMTLAEAQQNVPAGWRLPTIFELYAFYQQHGRGDGDWYWSDTPVAGLPLYAWHVYFSNGDIYGLHVDYRLAVRLVRL